MPGLRGDSVLTRLLAFGDTHIGSGQRLDLQPGDRLREQEQVFEWCLAQAREHEVDAVLFAGDLWENRKPSPAEVLAAERPLVRHRELGGPRVISIVGNHCLSSLDGDCAQDVLHEAGLIELVREPRVVTADGGARVCAVPWASVARLAASFDGPRDLLSEHAASLLVDVARDLHDAARASELGPDGSGPLILLTHFAISGTSLPSGLPVDQLREPVLPQDELLAIGYDLVCAGHIHKPQTFGGSSGFYVGSPMPLNFGESDGETRGPVLIGWNEQMRAPHFKWIEAPSRRFVTIDDPPPNPDCKAPSIEGAYVRWRVRGTEVDFREIDIDAGRQCLLDGGAYRVFVETIVEREARARDKSVDDSLDEREALRRWLEAQDLDPETVASALARAAGYLDRAQSGGFAAPAPEPLIGAVA